MRERTEERLDVEEEMLNRLDEVRSATCEALACLACFEPLPAHELDRIGRACDEASQALGTPGEGGLRGAALVFGLGEVSRNLREIDRAICAIRTAR